ncbi:transaldolase [Vigna unguiculata]|uniref:Transaldolase n=2 Tax=Vigna unguiculata TaxID=3917 RepID=A0A4D6L916_VIGUN|nr:transaldolase [Vigna unguiculata]
MEHSNNREKIKSTILHHLFQKQRQSPYYDNLCRPVSDLLPFIANGIRGVTTNPAIFQRAISSSNAYDQQLRKLVGEGKDTESVYWELVVKDIHDTCKMLEPIYNDSDGVDGYVSVAVSPKLANDTKGTIEEAKWLHKMIGCSNVYIKIPATDESILSMKEVISLGISVNATLIFCLTRYEAVIDAYLDGLEACGRTDLSKVSSAAAFYISRVDSALDTKLHQIGTSEALHLKGKGAIAQAVLAYQLYQKKFSGPRWEHLEKRGAKKQRLMWASTNVKNPEYPDAFYVDSLIGPDTISTMPEQALKAFMHHGILSRTLDAKVLEAQHIYSAIQKLGIQWPSVGSQLQLEVLDSFTKSFHNVLQCIHNKTLGQV